MVLARHANVVRGGVEHGCVSGGEGCQYPQIIAIDSTDGAFILYGTDVGGIYRSTNGGAIEEFAFQALPCA